MDNEIKTLEQLSQKIEQEKSLDRAIDSFIQGAQVVKKLLHDLEQTEGRVTVVIDDVEKPWEE